MTPAGWYPEAPGSSVMRWWDGSQWTPHTQPEGPPQVKEKPSITKHVVMLCWQPVGLIMMLVLASAAPSIAWLLVVYVLAMPFVVAYHIVQIVRKNRG